MSNRILCKFFAHGACLKGEHCEYAHDWTAPANNICTFYQRGNCAYGSRCRYDHVKVPRMQPSGSSSSTASVGPRVSGSSPIAPSAVTISGTAPVASSKAELSPSSRQFLPSSVAAWSQQSDTPDTLEDDFGEETRGDGPADQVICSFAAAGHCPRGEKCPHIHGDLCPTCGKHCLHPFRPKEREEHSRACEKMQRHLEALKRSQEIECSVCLERVLSKPKPGERKFGLMSECDHPFCISCIRVWRSSSPTSGMDVNSTLRACPICRKLSYFVIPSVIWYFSKEEKEEIIDNYKAKLKSIDCKYFDFGNGSCPFGTSCFYKHTVKPRCRNPNMYSKSYLHRRHKGLREEMDNANDEDVNDEDLLAEYLQKLMLNEQEENYASDYDEEDFLTPWERSFMWLQPPYNEDDDESFNVGQMDAVHVLFDYLYRPNKGVKEEVENVTEDPSFESLEEIEVLLKLYKLERKYSGDYDEEDFLTPWQRSFMWSQLGYDMSDDDD